MKLFFAVLLIVLFAPALVLGYMAVFGATIAPSQGLAAGLFAFLGFWTAMATHIEGVWDE